jgi:hypothetical protein
LAVVVNLWANGSTVLVVVLSSNIYAVLRATFTNQLLLSVIMEEDIDIAFDLLGG